ncbi:MAG: hypothetical protein OXE84_12535 [Rhodobacteraceae bacterium]|nr:hypothetical protein [Paracoccaceae bacterium]
MLPSPERLISFQFHAGQGCGRLDDAIQNRMPAAGSREAQRGLKSVRLRGPHRVIVPWQGRHLTRMIQEKPECIGFKSSRWRWIAELASGNLIPWRGCERGLNLR